MSAASFALASPRHRPRRLAPEQVTGILSLASAEARPAPARAPLAALVLLALALHGLAWRFVHRGGREESVPPHALAVDITLAHPLPAAPVQAPAPQPSPRPALARRSPPPSRPAPVQASTEQVVAEVSPLATEVGATAVPAEAAAPSVPAPAQPEETAPVGRLGYRNNPPPEYPESALERGVEGVVRLRVFVLAAGRPASVEVEQSSGSRALDEAAQRTVRKWLFAPATRGGQPIDGWASVPVVFKLRK